ncbi:MAG: pilus assembly protein [Chloroflexi bacterium]|nr:pilus assembly protein [Chloroflexota bacterium]
MPGRITRSVVGLSRLWPDTRRGQALVETALVVPLLLTLAFGVVAAGRVAHGQMAVSAIAREAARTAALADTAADAQTRGVQRGREVAEGFGVDGGAVEVKIQAGALQRGGEVRASARYDVSLQDLPLLGWARVSVSSDQVERIDLYRSRWRKGTSR